MCRLKNELRLKYIKNSKNKKPLWSVTKSQTKTFFMFSNSIMQVVSIDSSTQSVSLSLVLDFPKPLIAIVLRRWALFCLFHTVCHLAARKIGSFCALHYWIPNTDYYYYFFCRKRLHVDTYQKTYRFCTSFLVHS